MIELIRPGPSTAASPIANSIDGNAIAVSIPLETTESSLPPK